MLEAPDGPTWLGLTEDVLDAGVVGAWAVLPSCGAVVTFVARPGTTPRAAPT